MTMTRWISSRQASRAALVIVLLAVVGLSLNPRPESVLGPLSVYDKVEHFVAYALLAFFAVRALFRRAQVFLALAILSCSALGGTIELIQPYVGRNKDLYDFLVNVAGSAAGAAISYRLLPKLPAGQKR
jgi:VanZ family protein